MSNFHSLHLFPSETTSKPCRISMIYIYLLTTRSCYPNFIYNSSHWTTQLTTKVKSQSFHNRRHSTTYWPAEASHYPIIKTTATVTAPTPIIPSLNLLTQVVHLRRLPHNALIQADKL
jgi:hypothetical protein